MKKPSHPSVHSRRKPPAPSDLPIVLVRTRPIGTMPSDPRACESLGSWAFRLQKANMIPDAGVISMNAGVRIHKLFDVPTDPESTASGWARMSGRSAEEIAPMWLSLEGGPTSGKGSQNVMHAWALAHKAGVYLRFCTRHVVCPDCLAQDEVPYWRRSWRLGTTTICDVHRRGMVERCPRCRSAFAAPRPGLLPLSHCSNCGFDLRNSTPDAAAFCNRLLRETLQSIYRRSVSRDWPGHALPLPCLALRRLLNLACSADADVTSMEALASQRVEAGLARHTLVKHDEFICQTIEVRARAAWLLRDFAARRPLDFERLVHREARTFVADWLAEFHSLCAAGGPVHRSAEPHSENATV